MLLLAPATAIGKKTRRGKRPEEIEETRGKEERIRQRIFFRFHSSPLFHKGLERGEEELNERQVEVPFVSSRKRREETKEGQA